MAIIQKKAEFSGKCRECGEPIVPGTFIYWSSTDRTTTHATCPPGPDLAHILYNTEPLLP